MAKKMACPRCGKRSLLSVGTIMVEVVDNDRALIGKPYGRPDYVLLRRSAEVRCNNRVCSFRTTMGALHMQRKAENSNPKV